MITIYEKLGVKCLNMEYPKTLSFMFVLLVKVIDKEIKNVEVPDLFR